METATSSIQYLPISAPCFVCGKDNEAGLQTRFYVEGGAVKAKLNPQPHHCGYENVVHGGVVVAILDEGMGWAGSLVIKRMCYTAELKVRYLKPVPADKEMTLVTEVIRSTKRLTHSKGSIMDDSGEVYVHGEGRFIALSVKETLLVDDHLIYHEGDARPFDELRASV